MTDREPIIGDIVHVRHGGACLAAIVTDVSLENGIGLTVFHAPAAPTPGDGYYPYNSMSSARPTSGWHWKDEEHPV